MSSDSNHRCVVLDIGGTSTRAALFDRATSSVSRVLIRPTQGIGAHPKLSARQIRDLLLSQIQDMIATTSNGDSVECVSIAFAGPIRPDGRVLAAPTVWGETNDDGFDLKGELGRRNGSSRILVQNDVTAAGYRYLRSPDESLCIFTVGSGIGNKVFVNGMPHIGPRGWGGEVGHFQVDASPDAERCDCGGRGHLGSIASGRGALMMARRLSRQDPDTFGRSELARLANKDPAQITNEQIVATFARGDAWTIELIRHVAAPLGRMIAAIHLAIGIHRFIVYGGFATALGEPYRLLLVESAAAAAWNVGQDWDSMIELGAPDDHSGLIGAGRFSTQVARV